MSAAAIECGRKVCYNRPIKAISRRYHSIHGTFSHGHRRNISLITKAQWVWLVAGLFVVAARRSARSSYEHSIRMRSAGV